MSEPWRETLKNLLETPPALGVDIVKGPVEAIVTETESYIRSQIAVICDPDALEQTARKNQELMDMLAKINKKLESGELVEHHCGTWIDLGDQRCQCSQCGSVRYGNSKEAIEKYHLAPFCEKCGANMTPSRIDITEECEKRHFCYQFPCDAEGGCIGKGKCIRTKEGTFMKNDQ